MIRKIRHEDFKVVSKLVDETFEPRESMTLLFPNLFTTQELFSYVQEIEGEIVSFIGVSPIIYDGYYGAAIGAVCTSREHQGKGLMREMFPEVISDLKKNGVDFVLVSGGGKVYRENGVEDFGEFYKLKITNKESHDVMMKRYENDLSGLRHIHRAINKSDNFDYGITELSILLESQSVARLTGYTPETYYVDDETFLTYAHKENEAEIIEWGGNLDCVIQMIEHLNLKHDVSEARLILKREHNDHFKTAEKVINAGTIIVFNEQFDRNTLPFCRGYKFI